jgi:hypothetical protein
MTGFLYLVTTVDDFMATSWTSSTCRTSSNAFIISPILESCRKRPFNSSGGALICWIVHQAGKAQQRSQVGIHFLFRLAIFPNSSQKRGAWAAKKGEKGEKRENSLRIWRKRKDSWRRLDSNQHIPQFEIRHGAARFHFKRPPGLTHILDSSCELYH